MPSTKPSLSAAKLIIHEMEDAQNNSLHKQHDRLENAGNFNEIEKEAIHNASQSSDQILLAKTAGVVYHGMRQYIRQLIIKCGKVKTQEDIMQDAYITVMTNIGRYDPKFKLTTFFRPILVNQITFNNTRHLLPKEKEVEKCVLKARKALKSEGVYMPTSEQVADYIVDNIDESISIDDVIKYEHTELTFQGKSNKTKHEKLVENSVERAKQEMAKDGKYNPTPCDVRDYIEQHFGKYFSEKAIDKCFANKKSFVSLDSVTEVTSLDDYTDPVKAYEKKEELEHFYRCLDMLDEEQRAIIEIEIELIGRNNKKYGGGAAGKDISKVDIANEYKKRFDPDATISMVRKAVGSAEKAFADLMRSHGRKEVSTETLSSVANFATNEELEAAIAEDPDSFYFDP